MLLDNQSNTSTEVTPQETQSQVVMKVNKLAKAQRHKKVFLKAGGVTSFFSGIHFLNRSKVASNEPKDPLKKFTKQTVAIASALLIFTSFQPTTLLDTGFTANYFADSDYVGDGDAADQQVMVMNEEGFMMKASVEGGDIQSDVAYTDSIQHTVTSGQALSQIAQIYGVKMQTIMWENGITNPEKLRVGQVITIPPVDGVSHIAGKAETLDAIAKKYSVDIAAIKNHNNLITNVVTEGQRIYIPGGKKQQEEAPVVIVRADTRSGRANVKATTGGKTNRATVQTSPGGFQGSGSLKFIFPTKGNITQGFKSGHMAWDIANPAHPDVHASAAGKVVKMVSGCPQRDERVERKCGGGYGNFLVLDHGNGYQTLYAHLSAQYVKVGDVVGSNQAIGRMGNSGFALGITGIHLHFELFVNGAKKNPGSFVAKS